MKNMKKTIGLAVLLGMTVLAAIPGAGAKELDNRFQILPKPQKVEVVSDSGFRGSELTWIVAVGGVEMPVLGKYLDALPRCENKGRGVKLVMAANGVPESEEGYILEVNTNGVVISSRGDAGLFYGCQTLEQLMEDSRELDWVIPRMKITDWPAISYRAVHWDNKNHLDRTEYYYDLIDRLARYKINGVIWEIEDKLRFTRRPEVGAPNSLSKQEVQAISRYAKERHIEISPLIQGLGHATYILKHHWDMREDPNNDGDFCPSDPRTYETLFALYRDAMEAMPYGKYLHIGGDEVSQIGTDERCRATGKTPFELQLEWLGKVCDFVVANGRTPIFWDDMPFKFAGLWYPINFGLPDEETRQLMDFTKVDEVIDLFPKECIFMRWRYEDSKELGNQLVLDWYEKSGLKVMAATAASEALGVHMPKKERIEYIKGFSEVTAERNLEGIFATAWGDSDPHLKTVERPFIAQGEFGWNPKGRSVDEFKTAHARREFGLPRADVEFITEMEAYSAVFDSLLVTNGHRSPGFSVGEFTLIGLPDPADPGAWSEKHADRIEAARFCTPHYDNARRLFEASVKHALRNRYTIEVYDRTNELFYFSARILLALENYDKAADRQQALKEVAEVCEGFCEMRRNLLETFSKTRFMDNPDGYIAGNSHHKHLAAKTNNSDWVFWFELPMVKAVEKWIEEQTN